MTQKALVLRLLEARGFKGVGAHELVYQHGITRGAAVIHQLRTEGIDIETIDEGDEKLARYVLKSTIVPPKPLCGCSHRYAEHVSGFRCMGSIENVYCDCEKYRVA